MLSVSSGWVAFQAGAIESFIPAGAMCRTEPRRGPGLPYYADSSGDFRAAVRRWEAAGGPGAIDAVLAASRDRDALTLWHLLVRLPSPDRLRVARRFAELTSGVDAAGVARGDRTALEAAWNVLGLGHTDWWRTWKRQW
jgi:hypothetical protein